jgi:hypothetical protein
MTSRKKQRNKEFRTQVVAEIPEQKVITSLTNFLRKKYQLFVEDARGFVFIGRAAFQKITSIRHKIEWSKLVSFVRDAYMEILNEVAATGKALVELRLHKRKPPCVVFKPINC